MKAQAMTTMRHRVVRWTALYGWETRTGRGEWETLASTRCGGWLFEVCEKYRSEGYVTPGQVYTVTATVNATLREDA